MSFNTQIQIARLYKNVSKNGNEYFSGKLGYANVVLLKSNETAESGAEIWNLLLSEPTQKNSGAKPAKKTPINQENREAVEYYQAPFSDKVPF